MTDQTLIDFLRESNAIEGVYDERSLQDALNAWEYLILHKKLTKKVIFDTHRLLMQMQPIPRSLKGAYRDCHVQIAGRLGVVPHHIAKEMTEWIRRVNENVKECPPNVDDLFIIDHIQYERIHPFIDGNGRTGRMFLNWERIQAGLPIKVIWEKEKHAYYQWF